ncbi:hypothetical protein HPB51_006995 [Rhipicephalus microplus]|uniref:Uncharacterized protein n=1 Tax=Rhipicephalus microplus TaxID=6941 RepID=A0A9J6EFF2_RHIMP|nr:hypothetical protein HPB51_006995 [Rhipicephalus microplus]
MAAPPLQLPPRASGSAARTRHWSVFQYTVPRPSALVERREQAAESADRNLRRKEKPVLAQVHALSQNEIDWLAGDLKDVGELMDEFPGFLGLCLPSACSEKAIRAIGAGVLFYVSQLGMKAPDVKLGIQLAECVTKEKLSTPEQSSTLLAAS